MWIYTAFRKIFCLVYRGNTWYKQYTKSLSCKDKTITSRSTWCQSYIYMQLDCQSFLSCDPEWGEDWKLLLSPCNSHKIDAYICFGNSNKHICIRHISIFFSGGVFFYVWNPYILVWILIFLQCVLIWASIWFPPKYVSVFLIIAA